MEDSSPALNVVRLVWLSFSLCQNITSSVEEELESKIKAKYPGLNKQGVGSLLLQKRLNRGVSNLFILLFFNSLLCKQLFRILETPQNQYVGPVIYYRCHVWIVSYQQLIQWIIIRTQNQHFVSSLQYLVFVRHHVC